MREELAQLSNAGVTFESAWEQARVIALGLPMSAPERQIWLAAWNETAHEWKRAYLRLGSPLALNSGILAVLDAV